MSPQVIVIVLFAALLHAGWNFLVKRSEDPYQGMCAVVLGRVPYGLVVLIVSPSLTASSYSYVVIGALLHVGYQLFLQHSYRFQERISALAIDETPEKEQSPVSSVSPSFVYSQKVTNDL